MYPVNRSFGVAQTPSGEVENDKENGDVSLQSLGKTLENSSDTNDVAERTRVQTRTSNEDAPLFLARRHFI
jgi:hypothetical protein